MIDSEVKTETSEIEEEKTGLVVFGALHIILGVVVTLFSLIISMALLNPAMREKAASVEFSSEMIILSALFLVSLAVYFIWMGAGSIQARRWARALILVVSWLWLIQGASGLSGVILSPGPNVEKIVASGKVSASEAAAMYNISIIFWGFVFVVIPGMLVLFYGRKETRLKCERLDPVERWTDRCPLTVLALSILFLSLAASSVMAVLGSMPIPFFGLVLKGATATGVSCLICVFLAWLAWGIYKIRIQAWRAGLIATVIGGLSVFLTTWLAGPEFFAAMPFPGQQVEVMRGSTANLVYYIQLGVWQIMFIGLLLYSKKYFTAAAQTGTAAG